MTDEQVLSTDDILRAVQQVVRELAPGANPQDVQDHLDTLRAGDAEQLEVNLGAIFGELFDEEGTNAAFDYYARLVHAVRVKHNSLPRTHVPKEAPRDGDEPQGADPEYVEDM